MDKVFKKIIEGLEIFDTLYERHENASNQSQKEKLENDLKKEIKKLQRFREQVKNWQAANEIKDKNQLLEHRHLVEVAMEKYKVVEKGSKTKAYSDQSLAAVDEPEIDNEAIEFVKQSLDTLQQQTEALESEIEKLQPNKKGKKNIHNEEQKKELEELLASHQWHTEKLEIILRLLQNEILSVDDIMNLSDDITYYLDENRSPDFMFDDTIYDDIDLEADKALVNEIHVLPDESNNATNNNTTSTSNVGIPNANNKDSPSLPVSRTRSRSIQPISGSTTRSNSIPHQPTPPTSNSNNLPLLNTNNINTTIPTTATTPTNNKDSHEKPPVIQSIGTSSTHQATVTTLKPAPVPAMNNELNWSSVVTAAKKKEATPPPPPQNPLNTNALNAASVLEALKKQKPKDSTSTPSPSASSIQAPTPTNTSVTNNNEKDESISISRPNSQQQIQQTQQTQQPIQQSPIDQIQSSINTVVDSESLKENGTIQSNVIASSTSALNGNTPNLLPIGRTSTPLSTTTTSTGFTKSQSLAAATDGFRFLPPGIQSFILSLSSSKDTTNSTYSPFQSVNHTPNRTYPTGLKAIHLAESWNKISTSNDLSSTISSLDDDSLFFGYYYGRSNEERNLALQALTQKGWKRSKGGINWYFPRSIVSKGDGWNMGDYNVFNVDKWNVSERRNVKVDNAELA